MDFDSYTQKDIDRIEEWINNYPRRLFGYQSSEELFEIELSKLAA